MIVLDSVDKVFNSGKANQVHAVNNVSLTVADGEFLVIVGSNGSGKSSLLNLVAGSVLPGRGTISINNTDVTRLNDYDRSKWIARVFQNPLSGTAPDLSIIDNFRLAALRTSAKGFSVGVTTAFKNSIREKIATLGMGLENKTGQLMGTLSGGQRQALTLLMSVTDICKVLLLDEPAAALDPRSADIVMKTADNIIRDFKLTSILITHNLKDAYNYGNRIIQMSEGCIIKDIKGENKTQLTQNEIFTWFS
ncbi:ABC transporter ATP-binding protein [Mucilaginibacter hurinus]|uniref:ABC transporter ATP-binding protein n=1 Tax=Mucilaginibacter hurinus TaxID=2201324 RepID=A0A367GP41_9SPHI|nr:ATP-binding cassette domain-containing protein [Mucilaginibacter hurinus]RCH55247.1 ABC transporter ATP-binding protein [Mucilaginibacter hurinus]